MNCLKTIPLTAVQSYLFHRCWDLSTKIIVNKIRTDSARSQSGAQTTKFHCEKLSFVQSATTKFHLWWMNVVKTMSPESHCTKICTLWKCTREGLLLFAWLKNLFLEHENKNAAQKTELDVRLLKRFLKMKNKDRKIEDIPATKTKAKS